MKSTLLRWTACCVLIIASVACSSTNDASSAATSPDSTDVTAQPTNSTQPVASASPSHPASSASPSFVASSPTTPDDSATSAVPTTAGTLPRPVIAQRQGEEIGFGAIGPPIAIPQPWQINVIYTDLQPETLAVEFSPPNPDCIAAQANATIGRGGAILVGLWVEGDVTDGSCAAGAELNRVVIPLAEPLEGRRIYTSTVPDTRGSSERAELLADSIIGYPADDAIALIGREGFEVRDVTDADAVESDFNPERINIWVVDGAIDFATVG